VGVGRGGNRAWWEELDRMLFMCSGMGMHEQDHGVPAPVRELAEIFRDALGGQCFGGVDAAALDAAIEEVTTRAVEVGRRRAALAEASAALEQQQQALCELAHQALAYARIYARADAPLAARLGALSLGEAAAAVTERRARPRKRNPAGAPQLALEHRGADAQASAPA
jgi:hypothetical protein